MSKARKSLLKSNTMKIFLLILGVVVVIAGAMIINKKGVAFLFKPKASTALTTVKGEIILPNDKRCTKVTTAMTLDEEGEESLEYESSGMCGVVGRPQFCPEGYRCIAKKCVKTPPAGARKSKKAKKDHYWLLIGSNEVIPCGKPGNTLKGCLVLRVGGNIVTGRLGKLLHKMVNVSGYLSGNCDWMAVKSFSAVPTPTPSPTATPTSAP